MHLCALFQQRDGVFAVGAVVVHVGNFLALELVQAAGLLAQMLDQDVSGRPVAAQEGEVPLEGVAVLRNRQAVALRHQRNFVDGGFFGQREGDAGGQRIDHSHARAGFQALVALHATVGGVGGFALFVRQLHAVDTAIACIHQLEVVHLAVRPWNTVGRVGAGAVGQLREELLVGLCAGAGDKACASGSQSGGKGQAGKFLHRFFLGAEQNE